MSTDSIRRSSGKLPKGRSLFTLVATLIVLAAVAFPSTSFAAVTPGCDFFATAKDGTTSDLCVNHLSGSTFAGADGNLLTLPNNFGTTDWQNVAGLNAGIDLASGSGDNSFGQGTKDDDPAVSVVSGSIPPNKSDLTRFYQASETTGSGASAQTFLYLAWERTNVLGSANMDFEINQAATANLGTPGKHTLNRQSGDLLITYDFTNGGGKPTLGLNQWLISATDPVNPSFSTNVCLSSNTFPCWGDHITLNSLISEGAINSDAVADPILPSGLSHCPTVSGTNTCPTGTFGETAINLTGAGVFGSTGCVTFASTYLSSRASASFGAEKKDFVAPVPTTISNCGQVTIIKHTDPRGVDQAFSYDSNVAGTTTAAGATACPTGAAAFSLNDIGNTATTDSAGNTQDCFNVPIGNYTVTEGTEPSGFVLESLSGTGTTGTGASCTQHAAASPQADIVVTADSHVICTYTNQQQHGAIKVTKIAKNANCSTATPPDGCSSGNAPLANAGFEIWQESNGVTGLQTTASGGTAADTKIASEQLTALSGSGSATEASTCFDSLSFNDATHPYYVHESSPPTGYKGAADQTVVISANSSCASSPVTKSFTDTPLSQIRVTFHSLGGSGVTTATIQCTGGLPGGDDTSASNLPDNLTGRLLDNLPPNTSPGYTCTVKIDP